MRNWAIMWKRDNTYIEHVEMYTPMGLEVDWTMPDDDVKAKRFLWAEAHEVLSHCPSWEGKVKLVKIAQ